MTPKQEQLKRSMDWLASQTHPNAGTILDRIAALESKLAEAERQRDDAEYRATDNHNRAEEIIAAREKTIGNMQAKLAEAEQTIAEQGKRLEALADKVMQHAVGDDTVYNDMVADAEAALAAYRKEGE